MFSTENLYKLIKPDSNPSLITEYPVYIGGTSSAVDYVSGAIVIYFKGSRSATKQVKGMQTPNIADSTETAKSLIEIDYQLDVWKEHDNANQFIEVEREAIKIKEWFSSFQVLEYLNSLGCEILPATGEIRSFPNEEINKTFVNRAGFDFTIITESEIEESITIVEKVVFDNSIILQGD